MSTLNYLMRQDLKSFVPYSSARSQSIRGHIYLNANESPWNEVIELAPIHLNRYPEQQHQDLVNRCKDYFNVNANQLLITRGSDEAIDCILRLFCQSQQDAIMIFPPTYGMYEVSASIQGLKIYTVPLTPHKFQLDIDEIFKLWYKNQHIKVFFICSPNNPTGNLIKEIDILYLCQKLYQKAIIVVDEAYIEYAKSQSLTRLINDYDNLIVLRTLSKAFGMAGARIGMMLSNPEIIEWSKKILAPYPLPILSIMAALQSLSESHLEKMKNRIDIIIEQRNEMISTLRKLAMVKKVYTSDANFILVEFTDAGFVLNKSYETGIIIRDMTSKGGLNHCLRITIGLPEENKLFIEGLRNI